MGGDFLFLFLLNKPPPAGKNHFEKRNINTAHVLLPELDCAFLFCQITKPEKLMKNKKRDPAEGEVEADRWMDGTLLANL